MIIFLRCIVLLAVYVCADNVGAAMWCAASLDRWTWSHCLVVTSIALMIGFTAIYEMKLIRGGETQKWADFIDNLVLRFLFCLLTGILYGFVSRIAVTHFH